jgi:hypothetical protein
MSDQPNIADLAHRRSSPLELADVTAIEYGPSIAGAGSFQAALLATQLAEARRQGRDLVCACTLADDTAHWNMLRAGFKLAYARPNYSMTRQA